MRDIKFRAWDKIDKVMYSLISFEYMKTMEIMQFTGLKDRNDVEIYEGDICNVSEWYFGDFKESEFIGKVEFEDGCYFINSIKDNQYQAVDYSSIKNRDIKVIGNIYENPELLK